jgi:hypothetical protein
MVLDPETKQELPTSLAKPRTDLMTPDEFKYGLKYLADTRQLPDGVSLDSISAPTAPMPRTEGTQLLNNLAMLARNEANDRTSMNRIAQSEYGKDFKDLPAGGQEQKRVVQKYGELYSQGKMNVLMGSPVEPQVGETLYDRKAFEDSGQLIPRPDVTNRTARSREVVRISEKNMDTLQEVEKSAVSLDQIFDFADRIVTAKTPTEATLQSARYLANSNAATRMVPGVFDPNMATYYDMVQALGNGLAKAFGGERGVLTNVDVTRWVNALPKPGDTVEVMAKKKDALRTLAQAALIAQRRAIAGDAGEVVKLRAEMHTKLESVLKPLEDGGARQKPKKSADDRYNELAKSGMKDEQIYKSMAQEGY